MFFIISSLHEKLTSHYISIVFICCISFLPKRAEYAWCSRNRGILIGKGLGTDHPYEFPPLSLFCIIVVVFTSYCHAIKQDISAIHTIIAMSLIFLNLIFFLHLNILIF